MSWIKYTVDTPQKSMSEGLTISSSEVMGWDPSVWLESIRMTNRDVVISETRYKQGKKVHRGSLHSHMSSLVTVA